MDLLLIKESPTLLKEIEEPTESLVCEGVFYAMLVHREARPPTQTEVINAMYALDGIEPEDDVEWRINGAILEDDIAVRWDEHLNDFLLFPADIRNWWKVTMRYLVNYMEDLQCCDRKADKYHRQLIAVVVPHLPEMLETNQLPTCYPWETT